MAQTVKKSVSIKIKQFRSPKT